MNSVIIIIVLCVIVLVIDSLPEKGAFLLRLKHRWCQSGYIMYVRIELNSRRKYTDTEIRPCVATNRQGDSRRLFTLEIEAETPCIDTAYTTGTVL